MNTKDTSYTPSFPSPEGVDVSQEGAGVMRNVGVVEGEREMEGVLD